MQRGIRVLEGVRVASVVVRPDAVEVETSAGLLLAQAVVAADGVGSSVRKSLGIEVARYHAQALEIDTEPVEGDVERDLLLFDVSHRMLPGYYWDFPTIVDNRELVCRGVYLLKTARDERTIEIQDVLSAELRQRGLDLARYKKKRFAERGFELHSPLARRRVLLVGEAAGIDPVTGEGIAQAIQYGAVAGRYLARKLVERDLEFSDWRTEVSSTMIGRDLITRTLGVGLFYGAYRPNVERFLLDTPDFVRVGLQHFAGKRWSRRALANAAWGAAWHGMRALLGSTNDTNGTLKSRRT
jgi:flavin-dependent dehydrogenase